jgi:hypothetical protein
MNGEVSDSLPKIYTASDATVQAALDRNNPRAEVTQKGRSRRQRETLDYSKQTDPMILAAALAIAEGDSSRFGFNADGSVSVLNNAQLARERTASEQSARRNRPSS